MSEPVKAIPDGYNSVNVYLIVPSCVEALAFYEKAFGAKTLMRMEGMGGSDTTMHAEMQIGNSTVMMTDENPMWEMKGPATLGGSPAGLHLYVEDANALFDQAVAAGCEVTIPLDNVFWGDIYGKVKDPFGHEWGIATHVEDVSMEDLQKRREAWIESMAQEGEGSGDAPTA